MADQVDDLPEEDEDAEPAPAVEEPSETDKLIDQWWADSFPGSDLARNTLAWNCVYEAVADLKRRLRGD